MLTLYGSTTSPFVRRLRIWLANTEHEFVNLQIFEGPDRAKLAKENPTLKIPMIKQDGQVIYDSRVIFRFLNEQYQREQLSWSQENILTLIDSANDSFVELLMLQRSGMDKDKDALFLRLQRERVDSILTHLNTLVEQGEFDQWHYPAICLYCLVDWVEFRQLHDLKGLDALKAFREKHSDRIEVTSTDPRA